MSGSASDQRNMGIPSHISNEDDSRFLPSPGGVITVTNKPEMQWMVTTSHIDVGTTTSLNAVMSLSSQHQNPRILHVQTPPMATTSLPEYLQREHSSASDQKPRLTKKGKPRGTPGRKRKIEDHDLPPEEAAKRGLRRERNKLAAAKCRNRRRELTDRLQGETDLLEDHQGVLTKEIIALQQEKEHLEFVLASHAPMCKVLHEKSLNVMYDRNRKEMRRLDPNNHIESQHTDHEVDLVTLMNASSGLSRMNTSGETREKSTTVSVIQAGPLLINSTNSTAINGNVVPTQVRSIMNCSYSLRTESFRTLEEEEERRFPAMLANLDGLDQVVAEEPLNTPVCTLSTPSTTTSVFTFPNTLCVTSNSVANSNTSCPDSYSYSNSESVMSTGSFLHPGQFIHSSSIETCSQAHRRSSSSEIHHSPDSVKSPNLLSL